jgi:hypothetical protein
MESVSFFETFVTIYQTTRCHIQGDIICLRYGTIVLRESAEAQTGPNLACTEAEVVPTLALCKKKVLLIVLYGKANYHEMNIGKGFTLNPYGPKLNALFNF